MILIFRFAFALVLVIGIYSCQKNHDQTVVVDNPSTEFFNQNDPSALHPNGRVNPQAAPETSQFDFMVGEFICDDSLLVNGEWKYSQATWNTEYVLNGFGVKDTYRNDNYAGTSIRFFNTKKQKWDVYFFGMPGAHTGLWEGEKVGEQMVMRQPRQGPNGETLESRLTFYNITEKSFDWKGEVWNLEDSTFTVTWKINARAQ